MSRAFKKSFNVATSSKYSGVRTDSLLPEQQESARKLLRSADCYQQRFIKFPHIGIFHSYAEFLHAALIESDSSIPTFVPQPFLFYIGNRRYTPDCYYVKEGLRHVIELKPRGEMKDELRIPLEHYFERENMKFEVISNESIFEKETLALSWLKIIRTLLCAKSEDTQREENILLDRLFEAEKLQVGEIIYIGDRIGQRKHEIALFRLAHKGKVKLDLAEDSINFSTKVTLCT